MSEKPADLERDVDVELVRKFRLAMHALAAIWVLTGGLFLVLESYELATSRRTPTGQPLFESVILLIFCTGWCVSGIATARKRIWGLYAGMMLTYCVNLVALAAGSIAGMILFLPLVVVSHLAEYYGRRLSRSGVPHHYQP